MTKASFIIRPYKSHWNETNVPIKINGNGRISVLFVRMISPWITKID